MVERDCCRGKEGSPSWWRTIAAVVERDRCSGEKGSLPWCRGMAVVAERDHCYGVECRISSAVVKSTLCCSGK